MKILKEVSRKYKNKDYIKYKVNIPGSLLLEAGLKDGDELDVKAEKHKITLEKRQK